MISIKGLSRTFGRGAGQTTALKDISLEIPEGQFVAIVGTSGSGKTTLLNVIGGLDSGWKGEVSIAGQSIAKLSDAQMSKLRSERIGFVFQHFNLLDHLSCLENVTLPGFFGGPNATGGAERAREVLRLVGLGEKIDDKPSQLSGGQKQRVAIARAFVNRPRLILCDEPTGSLDRRTGLQIMDLFQRLNQSEGITLVIITHEEHVSEMASRVVRLEDGAMISDEPNDPVSPAQLLEALDKQQQEEGA